MHILTLVVINCNCIKTLTIRSLISSTPIDKDSHSNLMTVVFIMQDKGKSFTLLSSMLSAPKGSILSGITVTTSEDFKQNMTTDGHPALEPIWIQDTHLQKINSDWSKMTFNPEYGLKTVSPKSSNENQHWPLLDDEDLLDPLPEFNIANADPTNFEKEVTQKGLDEFSPPLVDKITPVPVTFTGQTGILSRHSHLIQPLTMVQPSNTDHAKTLQPSRQRPLPPPRQKEQIKQNQITNHPPTKIIREVEFNKVPRMSSRKVKPPVSKQVLPTKRGGKKPTQSLLNVMRPGFNNPDLRKLFALMKKLDTENPINTTTPEVALMMAQQRQQWLQGLNMVVAKLNMRESGTIFALYHQFPFPRYPHPVKSKTKEDTTNPLCESNNFNCMLLKIVVYL